MKKFLLFFILFVFLIFYIYHFTLSQSSININLISLVDISQNNSCLYTANTNTVDIISFFWEWPVNNTDTFYNSTLSLNLQIFFERN